MICTQRTLLFLTTVLEKGKTSTQWARGKISSEWEKGGKKQNANWHEHRGEDFPLGANRKNSTPKKENLKGLGERLNTCVREGR